MQAWRLKQTFCLLIDYLYFRSRLSFAIPSLAGLESYNAKSQYSNGRQFGKGQPAFKKKKAHTWARLACYILSFAFLYCHISLPGYLCVAMLFVLL